MLENDYKITNKYWLLINEKIDQSNYFLKEIEKQYEQPTHKIKYLFSAFLISIQSIPDYILAEANRQFGLGLKDEQYWKPLDFCKEAKNQKNDSALKFYRFWNTSMKELDASEIGKIIRLLRNIDTHKTAQKPTLEVTISIKNNLDYSSTISIEEVRGAEIKNNYIPSYIKRCKHELLMVANQKSGNNYNEHDLEIKISFLIHPNLKFDLKEACLKILDKMKEFDEKSQKILHDS